jgi:uncharacterized pyridoxamine 5'-phosphate oxidase family protein
MTALISKIDALNFIKTQFIMQIATCSNNKPAVSVMLFAMNDNFDVYFATHRKSFKSQNLLVNPKVGIAIWEHNKMLIQIDAEVEEVIETPEQLGVLNMLADQVAKSENFWPPVLRINNGEYVIFKAKPTWVRALDLVRSTISQESTPFTEINFK